MKEIILTQGQVALVDNEDYDWLNSYNWCASWYKATETFYAVRGDRNNKSVKMSRQIMGLEHGDERRVDHKDHNTLNNQRLNLRICTHNQNIMNRKIYGNITGYKGVVYNKVTYRYRAKIMLNRHTIHLGYFDTPEEAAVAYNKAAKRLHGEFALLNEV